MLGVEADLVFKGLSDEGAVPVDDERPGEVEIFPKVPCEFELHEMPIDWRLEGLEGLVPLRQRNLVARDLPVIVVQGVAHAQLFAFKRPPVGFTPGIMGDEGKGCGRKDNQKGGKAVNPDLDAASARRLEQVRTLHPLLIDFLPDQADPPFPQRWAVYSR
ncbi:hypothetical protein QW131_05620 [Roseibium salinum]|nr:hypothetical protein [Roseibium salinum]